MSAQGHDCEKRARSSNFRNWFDFNRLDANEWMATSRTFETCLTAHAAVRYSGKTGTGRRAAKVPLLTRNRHQVGNPGQKHWAACQPAQQAV
jgi:hypothetical protein